MRGHIVVCLSPDSACWQLSYDVPSQMGLLSPEPFRILPSDISFPSVFASHNASNSRVSEVSKVVLTFFMMSEARWTAVQNVVFFSKRSIVIKLPVMKPGQKLVCPQLLAF